MNARFELVRSDAPQPWHCRFRAANGRVLLSSENYVHKAGALNAVRSLARALGLRVTEFGVYTPTGEGLLHTVAIDMRRAGSGEGK